MLISNTKWIVHASTLPPGRRCSRYPPTAVITADAVSETRSKKHTPATMAKDKNRARRKLTRLLPAFGLTPQMVLSASATARIFHGGQRARPRYRPQSG